MRLFFALWPDADAVAQLADIAGKLTLEGPVRLVKPGNYHVTLAFLGEVPSVQVAKWQQIGCALPDEESHDAAPFDAETP